MFENINAYLDLKYDAILKPLISRCHYELAMEYAESGNLADARTHFIKSASECFFNRRIPFKNLFLIFLRLYVPGMSKRM